MHEKLYQWFHEIQTPILQLFLLLPDHLWEKNRMFSCLHKAIPVDSPISKQYFSINNFAKSLFAPSNIFTSGFFNRELRSPKGPERHAN